MAPERTSPLPEVPSPLCPVVISQRPAPDAAALPAAGFCDRPLARDHGPVFVGHLRELAVQVLDLPPEQDARLRDVRGQDQPAGPRRQFGFEFRDAGQGKSIQDKARRAARGGFEEFAQQRRGLVLVVQARPHQDGVGGFQLGGQGPGGGTDHGPGRRFRQSKDTGFGQGDGERHRHGLRHGQGQPARTRAEGGDAGEQGRSGRLARTADHQHGAPVILSGAAVRERPGAQQSRG